MEIERLCRSIQGFDEAFLSESIRFRQSDRQALHRQRFAITSIFR